MRGGQAGPPSGTNVVRWDPSLLAVSCEQIKGYLLRTLQRKDTWRHPVLLGLVPGGNADDSMVVRSVRYLDGWQYQLEVPEEVYQDEFVHVLVEVLLLEMAQRKSGGGTVVEIPPWLTAGLGTLLLQEHPAELTLRAHTVVHQRQRSNDPLQSARLWLQSRPALTLEQLSWPDKVASTADQAAYDVSAHLFVHELLRLPEALEQLNRMLDILPEYRNWQTAFLRAFASRFPRMLDLDQWWSLTLIQMTGRDLSYLWSFDESWRQLDRILDVPVQWRLDTNVVPMATTTSLQRMIQEWDFQRQAAVLETKLNHLAALRLRAAQELVPFIDDYRRVLFTYLEKRRAESSRIPGPKAAPFNPQALVRDTLGRLNELDARRAGLQRLVETAVAHTSARKVGTPGR